MPGRSEIFLTRRRPGTRPAHVEKRRHGGPIKVASHRSPLLYFSPLSSPLLVLGQSTACLPFRSVLSVEGGAAWTTTPARVRGFFFHSRRHGGGFCVGGTGSDGPEMMEEAPADLLDLVRLPDVLVVCSSTGWTDEKHMLYLRLLEESFVSQLHAPECHYKGLFNCSSRPRMHIESSKQIVKYESAGEGGLEIVEGDQAKSFINAEDVDSPSCSGSQKDEQVRSMDDNASTSDPVEEATPQIRETNSVQSSKCYSGKHRHSPSRSAEGSDQNFDQEAKGIGESRGFNQKRLKSTVTND